MTELQASNNTIAVFDLDHTITRHDTYLRFLLTVLRRRPHRLIHCSILPFAFLVHKAGIKTNSWLKEVFLTAVAGGLTRGDITELSESFVEKTLASEIYQQALDRIQHHKREGDLLVLASASFDLYVPSLGKKLGFDETLCTRAAWSPENKLLGKIDGNNCYGPHKEFAVRKFLENRGGKFGDVFVYSDHHSDLPVFLLADRAITVNPTEKLRSLASEHSFIVEHWQ